MSATSPERRPSGPRGAADDPAAPVTAGVVAGERLADASERYFRRRVAVGLSVAGALSLLATLLLPLLSGDAPTETRGPNAYSKAAIGHHAFVRIMNELDLPTVVSRYRSGEKVGAHQVLLIAEPYSYEDRELEDMIVTALGHGARVLVVLPKWEPPASERDDGALGEDGAGDEGPALPSPEQAPAGPTLVPLADAERVVRIAADAAERYGGVPVGRADDLVARAGAVRPGDWVAPFPLGAGPALDNPQTLVPGNLDLESIVMDEAGGGLLVAAFPATNLYLLADPDLLNTMGLGRGDNAVVLYRTLVDGLGATGLVVDEVVHGFKKAASIWAELVTFPLVLLTAHLLALLALALWAAMARFGAPRPFPPRVAPGSGTLIDNTATLLGLGGYTGHAIREYWRSTLRALTRAFAVPRPATGGELEALQRLATQRGLSEDVADLAARVATIRHKKGDARRALALARRIHRFREEMLDGYHGRQGPR